MRKLLAARLLYTWLRVVSITRSMPGDVPIILHPAVEEEGRPPRYGETFVTHVSENMKRGFGKRRLVTTNAVCNEIEFHPSGIRRAVEKTL